MYRVYKVILLFLFMLPCVDTSTAVMPIPIMYPSYNVTKYRGAIFVEKEFTIYMVKDLTNTNMHIMNPGKMYSVKDDTLRIADGVEVDFDSFIKAYNGNNDAVMYVDVQNYTLFYIGLLLVVLLSLYLAWLYVQR